jgi:hypothetical protein
MWQADGFGKLPLSNLEGFDKGIAAERVNVKHLSLLQVLMCCETNCRLLIILVDRI